ncbi:hypothetical protein FB451DRAFT_1173128 [Mycena latifolia]|nr:hypothetical protein FB451DRAFT_1173128 [Mycena latifolia]
MHPNLNYDFEAKREEEQYSLSGKHTTTPQLEQSYMWSSTECLRTGANFQYWIRTAVQCGTERDSGTHKKESRQVGKQNAANTIQMSSNYHDSTEHGETPILRAESNGEGQKGEGCAPAGTRDRLMPGPQTALTRWTISPEHRTYIEGVCGVLEIWSACSSSIASSASVAPPNSDLFQIPPSHGVQIEEDKTGEHTDRKIDICARCVVGSAIVDLAAEIGFQKMNFSRRFAPRTEASGCPAQAWRGSPSTISMPVHESPRLIAKGVSHLSREYIVGLKVGTAGGVACALHRRPMHERDKVLSLRPCPFDSGPRLG